jgi:hypothetical protein
MGSAGPVSTWHHHNARQRTFSAPPAVRNAGGKAPESTDGLDEDQQRLLAYTRAHQDGATYLFATTSWRSAAAYILYAGAKVLPMGGFTGAAPTPTGAQFRHLVATGRLHYVVLGGAVTVPGRTNARWVRAHCARVPLPMSRLYRCSPGSAAVLP